MSVLGGSNVTATDAADVHVASYQHTTGLIYRVTLGSNVLGHVVRLAPAAAEALAQQLVAELALTEIDERSAAYHEQQIDDAIDRLHDEGKGNQ